MGIVRKTIAVIMVVALGLFLPYEVFGGEIKYINNNEWISEEVVFADEASIEQKLETMVMVLVYNKFENMPEYLRINYVFYDKNKLFVDFNEAYKTINEYEKGLVTEQITKTSCAFAEVESIIISVENSLDF